MFGENDYLTNPESYAIISTTKERKRYPTMKKYFELNKPYEFDPTDLTAIIFTVCSVLGIATSINIIPLFLLGSIIGFATCFKARRINLIALNGSLLVLNLVNFVKMF
jgi:hypothetical protein